ncbi:hypothetical protein ANN_22702 [Periplaneta americana]|uniref:PiggyBac transposable element-derived protein domain-containing protein n=1 Tax=Periplaneta americana TaxID=6978 RepID=A0ABQ8S9B9_PERAM|nr:hypothetical protein ANN_22702 [Periplaneta americana]
MQELDHDSDTEQEVDDKDEQEDEADSPDSGPVVEDSFVGRTTVSSGVRNLHLQIGRCKFREYMPKKLARYGLKVMCMTDARTSYFHKAYMTSEKGKRFRLRHTKSRGEKSGHTHPSSNQTSQTN